MPHICSWCHVRPGVHRHHQVFRSRDAKLKTYQPNLVWLCLVCHDAAHGIPLTDSDGFNCPRCPLFSYCPTGQSLYHGDSDQTETLQTPTVG